MEETMEMIAKLMAVSARTAPKTRGEDFVEIKVIKGEKLNEIEDAMIKYGEENNRNNFDRDGENVRNSGALLLLSLNKAAVSGLNCGACGVSKCKDLKLRKGPEFDGGICAWRLIDLGIAVGSAVKTASILNADNRIMYRVGVVAKKLNLIEGEIVLGIPLSAKGKNIYFDRA